MQIIIKGSPKEIAALVVRVQGQRGMKPRFIPETPEGLSRSTEKVATGASRSGSPKCPCLGTNKIPL